jgi:hypothetical protein
MTSKANPYQRDGAWFFEVGPFANQCDALCDLLGRAVEYERRAADADQSEPPPTNARSEPPAGSNVVPFKPREPRP